MRRIKGAQFLDFEDCEPENFAAENLNAENAVLKSQSPKFPCAKF